MREKICMMAVFVVLFCMGSVSVYAAEEEHFSEIYDSLEEVPQPEQEIVNEAGECLNLIRTEIEMIPVTGRRDYVSSHIVYEEVQKEDSIPESSLIQVSDEETGQVFDKILPLKNKRYYNERWANFEFKVTFHSYGADIYQLGDVEISAKEPMPDMEDAEAMILALAGMDLEDCRIEGYRWSGSSYYDPSGEFCRDALASAVRRVWDCDAVYGGKIGLPDSTRYRRKSVYEKAVEDRPGFEAADVQPKLTQAGEEIKARDGILNRLLRFIKSHLSITIGVAFLAIFIVVLWILLRCAKFIRRKK